MTSKPLVFVFEKINYYMSWMTSLAFHGRARFYLNAMDLLKCTIFYLPMTICPAISKYCVWNAIHLMSVTTKSDICQTHSILKILFCFPLSAGHEDLIFSFFCIHFWALSVEYCCIEFVDHIFSDHTNIFALKVAF